MTANTALADECPVYEPAPAAFSGRHLSSMPYWGTDASLYMLSNAPLPPWWNSARSRLNELGKLAPGWDSYGAKVIASSARAAAIDVLRQITTRKTPPPSIVPTSDGSIQIEWHTRGIDLELRVLSPTRLNVSMEDAQNQVPPIEDEFQYDFRRILQAINVLSNR